MAHATLSPSAASRWMNCPGSVRKTRGLLDNPSEYAARGTMIHAVSETCLSRKEGWKATEFLGAKYTVDGFDFIFSREDAGVAQLYIDYVRSLVTRDSAVFIEQHVDLTPILGTEEDGSPQGGTADAVIIDIPARVMHVIDLKTGVTPVSPDSGQLKLYGFGAYSDLAEPAGIEVETVVLHIVQPAVSETPLTHKMTFDELVAFAEDAQYAADLTRDPAAPLIAGEAQCKWCLAKGNCPAAAELAFENLPATSPSEAMSPDKLSDEQLTRLLAHASFITAFIEAAKGEAMRRLAEGHPVPGWKLVPGRRGHRKWSDVSEVLAYLGKSIRLRRDVFMKQELMSPKQIEDLVKDGTISERQWEKIAQFITQSESQPTLAPVSDNRPALKAEQTADEVFSQIA